MQRLKSFFSRKNNTYQRVDAAGVQTKGLKKPDKGALAAQMLASEEESGRPARVPRAPARLKALEPQCSSKEKGKLKATPLKPLPSRMGDYDPEAVEFLDPPEKPVAPSQPLPSRMGYYDPEAVEFLDPPEKPAAPSQPLPSRMGDFDPEATVFLN